MFKILLRGKKMKALILAGGGGTRLWPVSRKNKPKQIMTLDDDLSLLQTTYKRISNHFKDDDIWVATASNQEETVREHLPSIKNYSFEPVMKNTAPAIGLATLRILNTDQDSVIVTVNSDHYIKDAKEYLRILNLADRVIKDNPDKILLLGMKTEYPETGYGYINATHEKEIIGEDKVLAVESFKEKPDLKTAKRYHKDLDYYWNPGIFIFKASYLISLFLKYLPKHYDILMQIKEVISDEKKVAKLFSKFEAISFDYGILEKDTKLLVIPASFGWSDIGSWRAIYDILDKGEANVAPGNHINIDSRGNLIYSTTDKLISTIGIDNSIIINTDDALLVAKKDRVQEVKQIVEKLKKMGLEKYL